MSKRSRLAQKLRERRERIRREKHQLRTASANIWEIGPDEEISFDEPEDNDALPEADLNLPSPYAMERSLRALRWAMAQHEFHGEEDANSFLNTLMGDKLNGVETERLRSDPAEMAQELAFQAMEAESNKDAESLARLALRLDPECVDARVVLARQTARSRDELIEMLEEAVMCGERALGEQFFEDNKGQFWKIVETRPYMRARETLVFALKGAERVREAIGHLEAMLELNPHDNQGNRDTLLGLYLETRNLNGATRLMDRYKNGFSAIFNWGRVLERYLSGDLDGAAKSLGAARDQNRYVEPYLTGKKPLPLQLPTYYSPGDQHEAVQCVITIGEAWASHPEARTWLARV